MFISKGLRGTGYPKSKLLLLPKMQKDFSRERVSSIPPLALSDQEQQAVLDILHSERFVDKAPREIYATLLDEGIYRCSVRTMYRILEKHGEVRERRNQLLRPNYQKPELLATASNQIWSWDITKLKGPAKWTYFYLYVILDIFSRYVVGWMVAHREQAVLAQRLIADTCQKQVIKPEQLAIHADRGSSMTSKPVAFLLSDLGITKAILVLTLAMIIPILNRSLKPSSIVRISPEISARLRMPGLSVKISLPGTTQSIIILVLDS